MLATGNCGPGGPVAVCDEPRPIPRRTHDARRGPIGARRRGWQGTGAERKAAAGGRAPSRSPGSRRAKLGGSEPMATGPVCEFPAATTTCVSLSEAIGGRFHDRPHFPGGHRHRRADPSGRQYPGGSARRARDRRQEAHGVAMSSYGSSITVEQAKAAASAALAEARAHGWTMAVAVVDPAGLLVYFEKMDDTQAGSVAVAQAKARSAALFRRPTKAFQDMLAAGGDGARVLALEGAVPVEGGAPLLVEGRIAGAIGVSGGTSAQDGQCAQAGVRALAGR